VSPSPSPPPRSEAEQIVLLTKELEWSRLKIQALEERLRLELIRKYGPKSEKLSDNQLQLLDLEPGVSTEEVEAESRPSRCPPHPRPQQRRTKAESIRDGRNCRRIFRAWNGLSPARRNNASAKAAAKIRQ